MNYEFRDLPKDLVNVTEGSFQLMPFSVTSIGSYSPAPRSSGALFMSWRAEMSIVGFETASENLIGRWRTFMANIQGSSYAFPLFDPTRRLPLGVAAGINRDNELDRTEILFDGAPFATDFNIASGSTIVYVDENQDAGQDNILIRGLVPDAPCFVEGDYLQVDRNLYQVAADALSDADGKSRVTIQPSLWRGVVVDDEINLNQASGLFVMANDQSGLLNHTVNQVSTTTITAVGVPWLG